MLWRRRHKASGGDDLAVLDLEGVAIGGAPVVRDERRQAHRADITTKPSPPSRHHQVAYSATRIITTPTAAILNPRVVP